MIGLRIKKFSLSMMASVVVQLALLSSAQAVSFSPEDSALSVISRVPLVDCVREPAFCRYIAALETSAFSETCPNFVVGENDVPVGPVQREYYREVFERWSIFQDEDLKAAVFHPKNKLRAFMVKAAYEFLARLNPQDLKEACSRLELVAQDVAPEPLSETLRATQNYENARASWSNLGDSR